MTVIHYTYTCIFVITLFYSKEYYFLPGPIPNCVILADQAYPDSEPTIATCFLEGLAMHCERMKAYNKAFILCRLVIEQIIGVLKRRFPTLRKGLEFHDLERCSMFVQSCIGNLINCSLRLSYTV